VETNTIIVGGGVIGCATAYYLAGRGLRVLLLERRALAIEASGANAGMVGASGGVPGRTLLHTRKSAELLAQAAEELGHPIELVRGGRFMLAYSPAQWATVQEFAASRQAEGLEIELLSGADARRLEPVLGPGLIGAAHAPGDGHVNPFLLTHAYAAAAQRRGAEIRTGIAVTGIEAAAGRVIGVRTTNGPIRAATVVLAAGAWSADLAGPFGVSLPVRPGRGQMLVTEVLPALSRRVFRAPALGMRQDVRGHLIIGSTVEDVGFDRSVAVPTLARFCCVAMEMMPALRTVRILRAWAGLRPMTPDGLAIIDTVPGVAGLVLATGHSRSGVSYGPVSGWLVAQLATEGRTELPLDPFRLARFTAPAGSSAAGKRQGSVRDGSTHH
jgi:glycine/D-amino acid oxidase-like deaminating enzyme